MKALKTTLLTGITAVAVAAVSIAQAGNLSAAQIQALEIQGQARNQLCQTSTLSREGYVALCGTKGAEHQPTRAELRALQIRGEAMNALYSQHQPAASRPSYRPSSAIARPKLPPPFKPIAVSPIKTPPPGFYTGNTNARMVKLCFGWKCSAAA